MESSSVLDKTIYSPEDVKMVSEHCWEELHVESQEQSDLPRLNPCMTFKMILIPVIVFFSGVLLLLSAVVTVMIYKGEMSTMWLEISWAILIVSSIIFLISAFLLMRRVRMICQGNPEQRREYFIAQNLRGIFNFRLGHLDFSDGDSSNEQSADAAYPALPITRSQEILAIVKEAPRVDQPGLRERRPPSGEDFPNTSKPENDKEVEV